MNEFEEFIGVLKNRISILDVVSKKTKLVKKGYYYFGLCPFHSEKTGSFKVDPSKGGYYCFGCGAHGDIFNFIMETEKLSFYDAVTYLADSVGLQLPKKTSKNRELSTTLHLMELIKNYFRQELKTAPADVINYLEYRKITQSDMDKFQIGYAPFEDGKLYEFVKSHGINDESLLKSGVFYLNNFKIRNKFRGRVIFPIFDQNGKCIAFGGRSIRNENPKYLNSSESDFYKKSEHLYGYNLAKRGKYTTLVLVEGYLDVLSMHKAGFDRTVASLGTTISDTQIDLCWKLCDAPIVLLDGDSAGLKAAHRWLGKILPKLMPGKTFKFAQIPNNRDPDSVISNRGTDTMVSILDNSLDMKEWLWNSSFIGNSNDNPEQVAAILKEIEDSINTINDKTIRLLYIKWLKDKKRQLLYSYKNNKSSTQRSAFYAVSNPSKQENLKRCEEVLLASIINHPKIIDIFVERLADINFSTPSYNKLKDEILKEYGEKNHIEDLDKSLYNEPQYFFEQTEGYASFVCASASDDEAILGWEDVYNEYKTLPDIQRDIESLKENLKKGITEDSWNKLKAFKKAYSAFKTKS